MYNSIKAILAGLALTGFAFAGEVAPADPVCAVGFTGSVNVGYDTDLIHRGQNLGQDVIGAGFTTSHDLGNGVDLSIGTQYHNVTDPAVGDRLATSAWAGFDLGGLDAGLGLNWYYFPEVDQFVDDNLEVGFTLGTSLGFADVNFGYYYDFEADGSYLEAGLSKTIALADCLDLNLGTGIGYGDDDYTFNGIANGGEHVYVSAGLTYHLTETAALSAYVAGNFLYGDAADLSDDDDEVYGGVSLSVSF